MECNAFSDIQGLENQTKLRCLFLQNNLIKKINNLENCRELDTLNLCHNMITKIENCGADVLPVLTTLQISHNYLRTAEHIEQLKFCKSLSVLDISHNRIEDILVVKVDNRILVLAPEIFPTTRFFFFVSGIRRNARTASTNSDWKSGCKFHSCL